jgi:hypothetical protein
MKWEILVSIVSLSNGRKERLGTIFKFYLLIGFYICSFYILNILFRMEFIQGIINNNGRDKGAKRPYNSERFVVHCCFLLFRCKTLLMLLIGFFKLSKCSFFTWFCEAVRSDAQVDEVDQ